jgi:hypothetical protein
MSEQEHEGKQKQAGRPIGSIARYATIGGAKRPDVQTSSSPAVETSKLSNVKKSRHPDWKQQTVYLPQALIKWLKVQAVQDEREISEIVAQAIEEYRDIHGA